MINKLENVSFIVFLITILLAPIAFLPSIYAPLDTIKVFIITSGVLVSFILYLISIFKTQALTVPEHNLFKISCAIIVSISVSTLLGFNPVKSFFGQGFEVGTTSFIFVLFISTLLTIYLTYKNRDRVLYIFGTLSVSFVVVTLFHVIRFFFGADTLTLGIFQSVLSGMLGRLADFGILAGVVFVILYMTLRFIVVKRTYRFGLLALLLLCFFCMFFVNSSLIWGALVVVLMTVAFFEFYLSSKENSFSIKRIPLITVVLIALTILLTINGSVITERILGKLNISQSEATLPWQYTLDIATGTVKDGPLFGAGPNRFATEYLKYKPLSINQGIHWNTEFSQGFGWIPTFIVTLGLVGFLLWVALIIAFCKTGYRALLSSRDDIGRFLISSTFFPALFLWTILIVYVPSNIILFLTFIFSGLFIATLIHDGNISLVNISEIRAGMFRKFIPFILTILLVTVIIWLYVFLRKIVAVSYFQSGISYLNLPNNEGIQKAEENFKKALRIDPVDTYYQALSEVDIIKISSLASQIQAELQKTGVNPSEESIAKLKNLVDEARGYTQAAVTYDPANYYNYIAQSRISEAALSLQLPDAYEQTLTAYYNAIKYNPYSPLLYLSMARIEASQNKLADAQRDIGIALQLKQNYLDAIFLLSQIQVNQGQIKEAITSVKVASQINPTNPLIFFQLGFLHYNDKNYTAAIDALSHALKLDEQYANARYFLGLSFARVNKIADAITQFEVLSVSNPDNQEVATILSNLRSGQSPFTDAKAPLDSKPEQRTNLPIKDR